jgi:hypothetical protein
MLLEYVTYKQGHWYLDVSLHCNLSTVRRPGGGSEADWELVSGNLVVDLFNDWLEELLQEHLEKMRNVCDAFYK